MSRKVQSLRSGQMRGESWLDVSFAKLTVPFLGGY